MTRTDGTYRPGVSIHEAAVMMGVSPSTVRRWVASGKLRSQRFDRPQGEVVRVFVGAEQMQVPAVEREQVPTAQVPTDAPAPTTVQVSADDQAVAIATVIQSAVQEAITPLVAANERQAEALRVLERENGTLRAERDAAREALAAAHAPESPTAGHTGPIARFMATESGLRGFARLWWPFGAVVLLVVLVIVVVLLGWRP